MINIFSEERMISFLSSILDNHNGADKSIKKNAPLNSPTKGTIKEERAPTRNIKIGL